MVRRKTSRSRSASVSPVARALLQLGLQGTLPLHEHRGEQVLLGGEVGPADLPAPLGRARHAPPGQQGVPDRLLGRWAVGTRAHHRHPDDPPGLMRTRHDRRQDHLVPARPARHRRNRRQADHADMSAVANKTAMPANDAGGFVCAPPDHCPVNAERTCGETRRRTTVISWLPGETSCLTLVWAVLDRASAAGAA
jgi:hypothetical protein